jgi:hypothetical protein
LHKKISAKKNQGINEVFQKVGENIILHPSNVSECDDVISFVGKVESDKKGELQIAKTISK